MASNIAPILENEILAAMAREGAATRLEIVHDDQGLDRRKSYRVDFVTAWGGDESEETETLIGDIGSKREVRRQAREAEALIRESCLGIELRPTVDFLD